MNARICIDEVRAPACADLEAAVHWRVGSPFAIDAVDPLQQARLAGRLVGAQVRATTACSGFEPQALVVVSTVLSGFVSMPGVEHEAFVDAVDGACGVRPQGILNVYMCTGWAYALRHFLRHTNVERLAIAILDVDIHNLAWQRHHPVIGASGFGVTTLLFTLPAQRGEEPTCAGPYPNSAFNEFLMALKSRQALHGPQPTFIPFMAETLAASARRVLAATPVGRDRNAELGHCFGADPWIGVIDWFAASRPSSPRTLVAGAIAFNGYYTFAAVTAHGATHVAFEQVDGELDALERALRAPPQGLAATASPIDFRPPLISKEQESNA